MGMRRALVWLALLAILGHAVVTGMDELRLNTGSAKIDQAGYLAFGLNLREHGALLDSPSRHPLYLFLISFFARREWSYFTWAKLVSLGCAVVGLAVIFLLLRRSFGDGVALLTVLLLSVNPTHVRYSGTVAAEALLVPLFFAAWLLTVRSFEKPSLWPVAGAVTGLAYLTKATGQTLVVAVLLGAVIVYRKAALKRKELLGYLAAYLVIVSPLLIYSTLAYGSPFYDYQTKHVLWFDDWEQFYAVKPENIPTIGSYLRTHSVGDIVARQWNGMWDLWAYSLRGALPGKLGAWDVLHRPFFGPAVAVLVLAVLFVYRKRLIAGWRARPGPATVTTLFLSLYFVAFGWRVGIDIPDRFPLPLYAFVYLLLAVLLTRLAQRAVEALSAGAMPALGRMLATGGQAALCLGVVGWAVTTAVPIARQWQSNPFDSDRLLNAAPDSMLARLMAGDNEPAVVLWGPSHTLPYWKHTDRFTFLPVPSDVETLDEFEAYLSSVRARYLILDDETVRRRRSIFSAYFERSGQRISFSTWPASWALADLQPGLPCEWCVFRLLASDPIEHPANVSFDEKIRLLGYDLGAGNGERGAVIPLTLYWQATDEIDADYTVFTHLLGPDGRLRGQVDGQPIRGLWPTSRWQPGQIVADRYDLTVAPDAPPGEYRLEVGMYSLATMERLPAFGAGRRLPDDAFVVGGWTLPAVE